MTDSVSVLQVCNQSEDAPCADSRPRCVEGDRVFFDTNRIPHGKNRVPC